MAEQLNCTTNTSFYSAFNRSTTFPADAMVEFAETMDLYFPPIVFVIGSVCNTLVIVVMNSVYFVNMSTSLYIRFTAILDNTSIMVAFPFHWVYVNFPEYIYRGANSDYLCKVLLFIGWYTGDAGIALTVAMTFERALAIKYPMHAPTFCTVKKARLVAFGILIIILAKNGHVIVKAAMVDIEIQTHLCDIKADSESFQYYVGKVSPVLHNIFLIVSFIIIISSNVIIIRSVNSSAKMKTNSSDRDSKSPTVLVSDTSIAKSDGVETSKGVRNGNGFRKSLPGRQESKTTYRHSRVSSSKNRQLAIMLMVDSLTIMVCTLPFALTNVLIQYGIIRVEGSTGRLVHALNLNLLYLNRCMNFFLYCISGERFRHILINLFTRKRQYGNGTLVYSVDSIMSSEQASHINRVTR